jgi:hypothetical protein
MYFIYYKFTTIPPGYIFISLDVQSLFSNFHTELLIDGMKYRNTPHVIRASHRNPISMLFYFYPISSVGSSFVMDHFIDTIMIETGHHIEHRFLYVDDTFIIIDEEEAEAAKIFIFN